jgi:hypothetical protein
MPFDRPFNTFIWHDSTDTPTPAPPTAPVIGGGGGIVSIDIESTTLREQMHYMQIAYQQSVYTPPAYYSLTEANMPSLASRRREEVRSYWSAGDRERQRRQYKLHTYHCLQNGWFNMIHLEAHNQDRKQWEKPTYSAQDRETILKYIRVCKKLGAVVASLPGSDKLASVGEMIDLAYEMFSMRGDSPQPFIDRMLADMWPSSAAVRQYDAIKKARRFVPPWFKRNWWRNSAASYLHLVKPSTSFEGQISYFQDPIKMGRDIAVTLKPGRYLAKYFGKGTPANLSDSDIRSYAAEYVNAVQGRTVFMTDEATASNLRAVEQEWLRVYTHGPGSCMKGNTSVRIFANPGNSLRLAYFTYDGQPSGQPIARCIVRDDRKEWLRIYPDDQGTLWQDMLNKLGAMGYSRGNLDGVRLRRVDSDDDVLCPYVDEGEGGTQTVKLYDDFLVCGEKGYDATQTSGYIGLSEHASCRECDSELDGEGSYWHNRGPYCSDCYSERYVFAVLPDGSEDDCIRSECIQNQSDGHFYHTNGLQHHNIRQCYLSGAWYFAKELVSVEGNSVHQDSATKLDVDHGGYEWAYSDEVLETTDGRTIHRDDALQVAWRDGKDYILHRGDDPSDELPGFEAGDKFEPIAVPLNAGKQWTELEDRNLLALFDAGRSLPDLATAHRRTTGAIRARLLRYGRVNA